jgi:hypothetical protein
MIKNLTQYPVLPCRNVREQRWLINQEGIKNNILTESVINNQGQRGCASVDASKYTILQSAAQAKVEPCREIPETTILLHGVGNGKELLQIERLAPNGNKLCLSANGTRIGTLPGANAVDAGYCQNIKEQRWTLRKIGNLFNEPKPPLPEPNFSGNLIRTGGSGTINSTSVGGGTLLAGGGVNFSGEYRNILPGNLPGNQWVYGGIQKAEFCNGPGGYKATISGDYISSPGLIVSRVDFQMYSRLDYSLNIFGQRVGYTTIENWRPLSRGFQDPNFRQTFKSIPVNFFVTPSTNVSTPVKFSAHVNVKGSGLNNYIVYDLGGIIDLGIVPYGECRIFQRQ